MGRIAGWWLGASACVSRSRFQELAVRAGGVEGLRACSRSQLCELGVEPRAAESWLATPDGESLGEGITLADARYPSGLRLDPHAPLVLYAEGNAALLEEPLGVALVGTRRCSGRGSALARTLARELAAAGAVVVSGLARGVDAAAHAGALAAGGGRTIAVLGHGLAHMSPASNRQLRDRIVGEGGLVLAGWPDRMSAERWTFPARNRWVAGIAQATVVVEAPERSGALITAQDALSMGRDVWVVPGLPNDPLAAGPLTLLAEQEEADRSERELLRLRLRQVLELLDGDEGASPALFGAVSSVLDAPPGARVHPVRSVGGLVEALCGRPAAQEPAWFTQLLAGAPVDQVARTWGRPVLELQAELTRRELAGELVRLPGGRYGRAR